MCCLGEFDYESIDLTEFNSFLVCAMYAFPDTLFSSVEKQKNQKNDLDMSLFKGKFNFITPCLSVYELWTSNHVTRSHKITVANSEMVSRRIFRLRISATSGAN